ncbi:hypothetical protein RB653_002907 [Dictyostelium firmibasis]|uniref:Uncharacterized protein n=1 Tax=Dictyostelium firmibasis TaxID=79012 RepID=A0AAN7TRA9_9MYCE
MDNPTDTESEVDETKSNLSDSSSELGAPISEIINRNNGDQKERVSIFEMIRIEKERKIKEKEDYIKHQRENDYPPISLEKQTGLLRTPHLDSSPQPISLEKQTGLFRTPHLDAPTPISLDESNDSFITTPLPPKIIPIKENPPTYNFRNTFKTEISPKNKSKNCKLKDSTISLIILMGSKTGVYGLVSIILFFVMMCVSLPLIPILVVVLKFDGFKCDNCTYSADDD